MIIKDSLCKPVVNYPPVFVKILTPDIPQGPARPESVGKFFDEGFTIDYEFKGGETVCLASTSDGKTPIRVDDRLVFRSDERRTWDHDFYDLNAHGLNPAGTPQPGISASGPQDLSIAFPPGRHKIQLQLWDYYKNYHSSTSIYLVIWDRK